MNEVAVERRSGWWLVVAIGCLWGLAESVGRPILHQFGVLHHNGSILSGCAVLFFAMAYGLLPRVRAILVLVLIAAVFRMYLTGLQHHPVFCRGIANSVFFAYFGEAMAFGGLMFLTSSNRQMSWVGGAAIGVISVVIAANVFVLGPAIVGFSVCVVPGTSFPSSVAGIPYAAAIAALGAPLGFRGGRKLQEFAGLAGNRGRVGWPVGLGVAAVCLVMVTLVHVFRVGAGV